MWLCSIFYLHFASGTSQTMPLKSSKRERTFGGYFSAASTIMPKLPPPDNKAVMDTGTGCLPSTCAASVLSTSRSLCQCLPSWSHWPLYAVKKYKPHRTVTQMDLTEANKGFKDRTQKLNLTSRSNPGAASAPNFLVFQPKFGGYP